MSGALMTPPPPFWEPPFLEDRRSVCFVAKASNAAPTGRVAPLASGARSLALGVANEYPNLGAVPPSFDALAGRRGGGAERGAVRGVERGAERGAVRGVERGAAAREHDEGRAGVARGGVTRRDDDGVFVEADAGVVAFAGDASGGAAPGVVGTRRRTASTRGASSSGSVADSACVSARAGARTSRESCDRKLAMTSSETSPCPS